MPPESRQWFVLVALVVAALLALGCGEEREARGDRADSTSDPSTTPEPTADSAKDPVASSEKTEPVATGPDGVEALVTVADGNIVAVDLRSGTSEVIVDAADLTSMQGVSGRIGGLDLSPDGRTVAFTYGDSTTMLTSYRLYTVPVDGSASPVQLLPDKPEDEYVGAVGYSPDGRYLVLTKGPGLTIVPAGGGADIGAPLPVPYPPIHVSWSPGGDQVIWLDHWERTGCCGISTAAFDPPGGLTPLEGAPVAGRPWFDNVGELRSDPRFQDASVDTDSSNRFVVTLTTHDDDTTEVQWWPSDEAEPSPRPLSIPVRPDPWAPAVW